MPNTFDESGMIKTEGGAGDFGLSLLEKAQMVRTDLFSILLLPSSVSCSCPLLRQTQQETDTWKPHLRKTLRNPKLLTKCFPRFQAP